MAARTVEIYADTRGAAKCKACEASIEFAENVATGRRIPFNAPIVALRTKHDGGGRLVEVVDLETSHFITCPKASEFRR